MTFNVQVEVEELVVTGRFTDSVGNARKIENPSVTPDGSGSCEILENNEYTDEEGNVGTELKIRAYTDVVGIFDVQGTADPKLGDPVGEITFGFSVDGILTEASGVNFTAETRPRT